MTKPGTIKDRPSRDVGRPPGQSWHLDRRLRLAGAAAIAVALIAVLRWTWGTWPDILIDFGRELYVPWQMIHGKLLYRDIAFFNGPFSQSVNALVFRLFGASFRTLAVWNVAVTVGLIVLLHHALRRISSWWTATAACLVFVLLFACGTYSLVGNYNYVSPYSHEIVHGLALAILTLVLLWRQTTRRGMTMTFLGGLALGLTFLTKTEVFFAAAAASIAILTLTLWTSRASRAVAVTTAGVFLAGAIGPPLIAFALLSISMPASTAFHGLLGSLPQVGNHELSRMEFYRKMTGTADSAGNIAKMLKIALYLALFFCLPVGIAKLCKGPSRRYRPLAIGLGVIAGLALWLSWKGKLIFQGWLEIGRPLPLAMLGVSAFLVAELARHRGGPELIQRRIRQLSFVILAEVLLAKILLSVHLAQYGFALAMPSSLLVVVALIEWVPRWIRRSGGAPWVFAAPAIAAIAVGVVIHLQIESVFLGRKTLPVQDPRGGSILADAERGKEVNEILQQLRSVATAGQTLAVLPEGVMINYLSEMPNPTPYINFMPPEFVIFGSESMVRAFRSRPPDFILLMHRNVAEYGYHRFGQDYGQELFGWIRENYQPIWPPAAQLSDEKAAAILLKKT